MVAAFATLCARHSSELSGPKDDCVLQHSALFQILDEGGSAPRKSARERTVVPFNVLVTIPVSTWEAVVVAAPDLNESDATFEEASCCEAFASENVLFFGGIDFGGPVFDVVADSVQGANGGRFFCDIEGFRCRKLHPCS